MKKIFGLFLLGSLGLYSTAQAATVTIITPTGVSGIDGFSGDPAADGTDGSFADAAIANVSTSVTNQDLQNTATATAGNGGSGGDGGDGIDGSDLNLHADAGSGGNGATGGAASATASTTLNSGFFIISSGASATGGNGGSAGTGGIRTDILGQLGFDGNAGSGGTATASATTINTNSGPVSASATATGGNGGAIRPDNRFPNIDDSPRNSNSAGNGGVASLGIVYGESQGGPVNVFGTVEGGHGGDLINNTGGRISAQGAGNGASQSLTNALDGSTTDALTLDQRVVGGNAGTVRSVSGYGSVGVAGSASSTQTRTGSQRFLIQDSEAIGGNGSNFQLDGAIPTFSGAVRAGDGADATAHTTTINTGGGAAIARAFSGGGSGGNASSRVAGVDAIGGNGGQATSTAYAESVGGAAEATAMQTGGAGGGGSSALFRGQAADSIMVDAVSGSSDIVLRLNQRSSGGRGGGNSVSSLTATNPGGGFINSTLESFGGGNVADNPIGGSSHVDANLSTSGGVSIRAISTAGSGRNGGTATLGPILGTSSNGGNVTIAGIATGGNSMVASGGDIPGNGASVSLTDVMNGSTTGLLDLSQSAIGGNGYSGTSRLRGATTGNAGDAFSSLSRTTTEASRLTISSSATGGTTSRDGNFLGVAADGGLATGIASGTITGGSSDVSSSARGGNGGAGNSSISSAESAAGAGGNALASSDATTLNGSLATDSLATSEARGGNGGIVSQRFNDPLNLSTIGGNGGDANSTSTASASGSRVGRIESLSTAIGGRGGNMTSDRLVQAGDGGNAFAQSTSELNAFSSSSISAAATATGGAGGNNAGNGLGGRGGDANAIAEVIGANNSNATATATPGNSGQGNTVGNASATSRISSGTGIAIAEIGNNAGLVRNSSVTSTAFGSSPLASTGIESRLSVNNTPANVINSSVAIPAAQALVADSNLQSVTQVDILPDATAVNQALNGNSGVASDFDLNGSSDLLALMSMGAMQDGSINPNSFSNDISLSMDMTQLSSQQDLIFGFMNPVFTGSGFDSMTFQVLQEGNLVVDEIFSDVFSADSFFNDQTLNLGDWALGLTGDLDLQILVDFNISGIGDSFYFDLAYGNSTTGIGAVPVPAAVWLFGSGLIALLGFVRKRK